MPSQLEQTDLEEGFPNVHPFDGQVCRSHREPFPFNGVFKQTPLPEDAGQRHITFDILKKKWKKHGTTGLVMNVWSDLVRGLQRM